MKLIPHAKECLLTWDWPLPRSIAPLGTVKASIMVGVDFARLENDEFAGLFRRSCEAAAVRLAAQLPPAPGEDPTLLAVAAYAKYQDRIATMLSQHAQGICGCESPACTDRNLRHARGGGAITTTHILAPLHIHDPNFQPGDDNDRIAWMQTNAERSKTTLVMASEIDWADPDPVEETRGCRGCGKHDG